MEVHPRTTPRGLTQTRLDVNAARMLQAWSGDAELTAARAAVDTEISAVELAERITKVRPLYRGR